MKLSSFPCERYKQQSSWAMDLEYKYSSNEDTQDVDDGENKADTA